MALRSWLPALVLTIGACADDPGAVGSTGSIGESSEGGSESGGSESSTAADTTLADASGGSSSSSSTSVDTTDAEGSSSSTGAPASCEPPPACDAAPPPPGPFIDWEHTESTFVTNAGDPRHRGRDMFYLPDDEQWVIAKFAYAANDWDLSGERVDLYLLRDCVGEWEGLGSATTTFDDEHPTIEGVVDSGGWIFFQIPEAMKLGVGRHRIWAVVRGDGSSADVYLDIVEPGTPIFVADVDGTLTTTETEEFGALFSGTLPEVRPDAPEALWELVDHGYHAFYLTARPEWLGARTRAFIEQRGLPPGLYHTTLSFDGALGSAAVEYKSGELDALADRMLEPAWVFGNTDSDGEAYEHANVQPLTQRVFVQFDDAYGGRRIEGYDELLGEFAGLPLVCE